MNNMTRCMNGHLFMNQRHGTICPYCNVETATKERKETGITEDQMEEVLYLQEKKPVCGWLVCIDGPRKGKDYKVAEGKNFIGRADDMDIQILGDNKIARRNHCSVAFDEKKGKTYLIPGDSNGMVYLNGGVIFLPAIVEAYNIVEIGKSKFLYVPFCGEQFNWEGTQDF